MPWITATELEQWADRLDSQSALPAVVWLAIHGSGVQVREVDFPAGDSVIYPGLDGYLVAEGDSPFVPAGPSVWEVGTSAEVRDKANRDYRKRTHVQELDIDRSQATFVFVTPRRWPRTDKEGWIAGKRADGIWRDVKVVDADMLDRDGGDDALSRPSAGPTEARPAGPGLRRRARPVRRGTPGVRRRRKSSSGRPAWRETSLRRFSRGQLGPNNPLMFSAI